MILHSHPSDIAQILGIDNYVALIIYQETKYYCSWNDNEENFDVDIGTSGGYL